VFENVGVDTGKRRLGGPECVRYVVLDHLLLALALLPLVLVLMCVSSSLCLTHAWALQPRWRPLASVRELPHTTLPLLQARNRVLMVTKGGTRCMQREDVVRLFVGELVDPELELPLPTAIRPPCLRDIRFLFLFEQHFVDNDLDNQRLEEGGGEDEGHASTWCCEADDVERGFLRRVTGVGL
jgi:hypothetical protein